MLCDGGKGLSWATPYPSSPLLFAKGAPLAQCNCLGVWQGLCILMSHLQPFGGVCMGFSVFPGFSFVLYCGIVLRVPGLEEGVLFGGKGLG